MKWRPLKALAWLIFSVSCVLFMLVAVKYLGVGEGFFRFLALWLSWPAITGSVVLFFLLQFNGAIDNLIRRVASMKLPGGVEIQSQSTANPEPGVPDGALILSTEQQRELQEFIRDLEQQRELTVAEKTRAEQLFQRALIESIFWEFQYLNYFFVPNTKLVLYWVSQSSPRSRQDFHKEWQATIPDVNEREAILSVLRDRAAVEEDAGFLRITPKGYGFLQFVGFIPATSSNDGSSA